VHFYGFNEHPLVNILLSDGKLLPNPIVLPFSIDGRLLPVLRGFQQCGTITEAAPFFYQGLNFEAGKEENSAAGGFVFRE
jgi:hypothetical protein